MNAYRQALRNKQLATGAKAASGAGPQATLVDGKVISDKPLTPAEYEALVSEWKNYQRNSAITVANYLFKEQNSKAIPGVWDSGSFNIISETAMVGKIKLEVQIQNVYEKVELTLEEQRNAVDPRRINVCKGDTNSDTASSSSTCVP